ncbi:hypothetical protein CPC08DRAFT_769506 [Agrocybe pediades]|nr:hypothetical protein CPC08DRAFT_769506 [Agrocybe pediades]
MSSPPQSPPPLTQFHPRFNTEVFMIAFSVEGQGFKANAAQLCIHSEVIRTMLHGDGTDQGTGKLGINGEGSADRPIVVHGCSAATFANFMTWLNHAAWEEPGINGVQGYLDVLHMTHLWEMRDGFTFAVNALSQLSLRSAHKIYLAKRYGVPQWIPVAVRLLLLLPLDEYTEDDYHHLGYASFTEIAKGKEMVARTRIRCGFVAPYPTGSAALDGAPYCPTPESCKRIWFESWGKDMMRRILNPKTPLRLSHVPETLRSMSHSGMHTTCKAYLINWMETSPTGFDMEEKEIVKVITAIMEGAMVNIIS